LSAPINLYGFGPERPFDAPLARRAAASPAGAVARALVILGIEHGRCKTIWTQQDEPARSLRTGPSIATNARELTRRAFRGAGGLTNTG